MKLPVQNGVLRLWKTQIEEIVKEDIKRLGYFFLEGDYATLSFDTLGSHGDCNLVAFVTVTSFDRKTKYMRIEHTEICDLIGLYLASNGYKFQEKFSINAEQASRGGKIEISVDVKIAGEE